MDEMRAWANRLERLGVAVQRHLSNVVEKEILDLRSPVAYEGGDTIFAIDQQVEPVLVREIEAWPSDCRPLLVIAEGWGSEGRRIFGGSQGPIRFRLIIDPIDGSRCLMYDKRSGWFVAAIAYDRGEATSLSDTFAAVLVELPTSKQWFCDSYVATVESPATCHRYRVGGESARPLAIKPSTAVNLEFGFAQVSNFFPGVKMLASELLERIVHETLGGGQSEQALVFDDQYISTGGQMVELICGHDRFCCDLRPLLYDIIQKQTGETVRGLECHPYDVAGALVAKQAGVLITDGFGNPLECPLDVSTGVHWCGYANQAIARQIQPVINRWLKEHNVVLTA